MSDIFICMINLVGQCVSLNCETCVPQLCTWVGVQQLMCSWQKKKPQPSQKLNASSEKPWASVSMTPSQGSVHLGGDVGVNPWRTITLWGKWCLQNTEFMFKFRFYPQNAASRSTLFSLENLWAVLRVISQWNIWIFRWSVGCCWCCSSQKPWMVHLGCHN